jgi:hypothetical protein
MVDAMCANNKKQFLTAKAQQVLYFLKPPKSNNTRVKAPGRLPDLLSS